MKNVLFILAILAIPSCSGCKQKKAAVSESEQTAVGIVSTEMSDNEIEFVTYPMDGLFLKGKVRIFDIHRSRIGTLETDKITPVQISERTEEMYNVEGCTDYCQKAYFLKVRYESTDYIMFGQDVYHVTFNETHSVVTASGETLTLLPISNFDMETADENGLTGCDDYSLLALYNETKGIYSLMQHPKDKNIHSWGKYEYAILSHNEGVVEGIDNVSLRQDTLIVGIIATYQEGGASYKLKAVLSGDFPKTEVSDFVPFEDECYLREMSKKMLNFPIIVFSLDNGAVPADSIDRIEETCLITVAPPVKHFEDEDSPEADAYFTAMDDWAYYAYELGELLKGLGVKTAANINRRYLSFALVDGKRIVVDTEQRQNGRVVNALLYRKGRIPLLFLNLIPGDNDMEIIKDYLQAE